MKQLRAIILAALLVANPAVAFCQNALVIVGLLGDSLTGCSSDYPFGYWGTSYGNCGVPDAQTAATYYVINVIGRNMAISGTRLDTGPNSMVSIAPTYIDPITSNKSVNGVDPAAGVTVPTRKYVVICATGSNDGLTGSQGTVPAYMAALASACVARKTAGFDQAWLITYLPRGDNVLTEANRAAGNALVRDPVWRAANNIDGYVDLAGEPYVGNPANLPVNNGGSTWCYNNDSIHYNSFCGQFLANGPFTQALRSAFPDLLNFVLERDLNTPRSANDNTPLFLRKVA